jgi:hypothetical protein
VKPRLQPGVAQCGKPQTKRGLKIDAAGLETRCRRGRPPHKNRRGAQRFQHIAVQTVVVCRLRAVVELGRPRKTMACPTANLLYYAALLPLGKSSSGLQPMSRTVAERERGATKATRAMPAPSPARKIDSENNILSFIQNASIKWES